MDSLRQMNITGLLVLFLFNASLVLVVIGGQLRETSTNFCQSSDDIRSTLVKVISAKDTDLRQELATFAQKLSQCVEPNSLLDEDWTLVFHGQAYVRYSVLEAYKTGKGIPDQVADGCRKYASGGACDSHYRNGEILNNWRMIDKVRLVIYKGRKEVNEIIFDAAGTNYLSWFKQEKIISSSWDSLLKLDSDIFSIEGTSSQNEQRHFFISHVLRKCKNSDGWFVVVDSPSDPCHDDPVPFPVFLYSSKNDPSAWISTDTNYADAFDVYVSKQ